MIQRCDTETENAFSRGIASLKILLRCLTALLSTAFPSKTKVTCSNSTLSVQRSGNSAISRLRRCSQFQKHSTNDRLDSAANLSPSCVGMTDTKPCPADRQANFTLQFASWRCWSGATKFLFRFLPETSTRSLVQASTSEQLSPTLRLLGQFPTNSRASVGHWDDELNHTVQQSAEAQLRVVRTLNSSASDYEPGTTKLGPSSCQERIHQNEENNVSQCIADRRMSDRDHRRRAA